MNDTELQQLDSLRAELAELTARRGIQQALNDYMRGQDRLLPQLQRQAFHEDGWVDCGLFAGRAWEFVDFAQDFLAQCDASQHLIGPAPRRCARTAGHISDTSSRTALARRATASA